jgi:hypothetical protein
MSTTHTDIYLEGVPDVLAEKCDRLCSLTDKIEKLEVDASGHLRGAAGGCITDDAEITVADDRAWSAKVRAVGDVKQISLEGEAEPLI